GHPQRAERDGVVGGLPQEPHGDGAAAAEGGGQPQPPGNLGADACAGGLPERCLRGAAGGARGEQGGSQRAGPPRSWSAALHGPQQQPAPHELADRALGGAGPPDGARHHGADARGPAAGARGREAAAGGQGESQLVQQGGQQHLDA
ncbi:unnamed protein product, partial [Effrenium voratum]